jgi:hypothetical protein
VKGGGEMNEKELKEIVRIIGEANKVELRVGLPIGMNGFTLEVRENVDSVKIEYSFPVNLPNWERMRGEEVITEASKALLSTRQSKITAIKRWCKKQQQK